MVFLIKFMEKFENIPDALEAKWKELATIQAQWETLDENKKNILASIMLEYEWSISHREMLARANLKYQKHLESIQFAREEMLKLKAEINALEISFEWYRSANANERARINMR